MMMMMLILKRRSEGLSFAEVNQIHEGESRVVASIGLEWRSLGKLRLFSHSIQPYSLFIQLRLAFQRHNYLSTLRRTFFSSTTFQRRLTLAAKGASASAFALRL